MPDHPAKTWHNLRSIVSSLIEAGLVSEFRGAMKIIGEARVEICADKLDHHMSSTPDILEILHHGFYSHTDFAEISRTRNYTAKFVDGAVLQYFCVFDADRLVRQRLTYYQSPFLHPYDSKAVDYDEWIDSAEDVETEMQTLFAQERFQHRNCVSLRLEYAPESFVPIVHPRTHLHLGDSESCRIPVSSPLGVAAFFRVIIKNFYCPAWPRVNSKLAEPKPVEFDPTLTAAEKGEVHICA